ncbi:MAG: 6-pyruvoyl-tetrahydropterin synthase-related protein [Chloroflexota bacterium]
MQTSWGNRRGKFSFFTFHSSLDWFLLCAFLIAFLAAGPLLSRPGLLNTRGGGDSPFLLQRLQQLETAVTDGHFPVRWMPDANYGYGYPFFNFYAPLSIYVAAGFRLGGFTYVRAIQLAQLSGFLVAAWAMYRLGRRWFGSPWAGLLASVAYTLAPFHLVNVYVRGDSLAEFWAMAFYPLVLLAAGGTSGEWQVAGGKWQVAGAASRWLASFLRWQVASGKSRVVEDRPKSQIQNPKSKIALLSLAYAGLILSHNISALIFSPFLLLYLVIDSRWQVASGTPKSKIQNPKSKILALLLGLALSAWFWLPALGERANAQLKPVTSGYFHYSNHFRGRDLVQPTLFFDYDVADGRAFRMGLAQAVTAGLGLLVLLATITRRQPSTSFLHPSSFILLTLLLSTLLITPLSRPLWDHLPLLSFAQFPWRFLSVQALATALATAALARLPGRRVLVPATCLLLLAASLGRLKTDHLRLADSDVTAERLAQYEWFTGNIGSTVSAEYLPPTVQPRPYTSAWLNQGERNRARVLSGQAEAQIITHQTHFQSWRVEVESEQATIMLPTLFWPGWRAEIDGQPAGLRAAPGSGLMMMDAPAGQHTLDLRLGRTPLRLAAELLSLAAGSLLLALLLARRRRIEDKGQKKVILHPSSFILHPSSFILIVAIVLRLWPEQSLPTNDLTWDLGEMGYLHHDTAGVPFDNGAILQGYDYCSISLEKPAECPPQPTPADEWMDSSYPFIRCSSAAQPCPFAIALTWTVPEGVNGLATLVLTTPAVYRFPQAPLLVSQTQPLRPGQTTYHFEIPANAPAGLYVPRLTLDTARPLTPSGRPRGDLFLPPIRLVTQAAGLPAYNRADCATSVAQAAGLSSLQVTAVQVSQRDATTLDAQLAWQTAQPLSHNDNVSLRLVDAAGRELATFDSQPGYGYQPTVGWPAGQWVNDWLALPLPEQLTGERPFALVVRLYEPASGQVVLIRRLGELTWSEGEPRLLHFHPTERVFDRPTTMTPFTAVFGQEIALRGYDLRQSAESLNLTLYWEALVDGQADYLHFVHLLDPLTGQIVAQDDAMPRRYSYPTSQWAAGEIVADPLTLDLRDVPPGEYRLVVGLYRQEGGDFPRLPAVDEKGQIVADGRAVLSEAIIILPPGDLTP